MQEHPIDPLTRRAVSAVSRRRSLLGVGAIAIVSALPDAPAIEASKKSKKAKKRARKKCNRQIDTCRDLLSTTCASDPDCEPEDVAPALQCCELFRDCQAEAALDCLFLPFTQPL